MTLRCLVTGGAGFIGSHLAGKLLDMGYEVTCIDNFDEYYSPLLKKANIATLIGREKFNFIHGSILDKTLMKSITENIDYIFHNAAQAGVGASISNPSKTNEVNVSGGLNILEAARKNKVKKVINASSSSVYGLSETLPLSEDQKPMPISPYGVSKLCMEHYCEIYRSIYELDTVSLRYFTVFGPRMRPDLAISIFTHNAIEGKDIIIFGDGNKTRDFTYIDNIIEANILSMTRGHGIYNIGGGEDITVKELAEKIIRLSGSRSAIVYNEDKAGDMDHTLADNSKARRELSYHPKVDVGEGLKKYLAYVINEK